MADEEIEELSNLMQVATGTGIKGICGINCPYCNKEIDIEGIVKGVKEEFTQDFNRMINETWEERDIILNKLDTSKRFNCINQSCSRVEKDYFRELLKSKLEKLR